jgi:hypothetical protein
MDIRHSMVTEAGGAACVFAYNFSTNPIAGENPTDFLSGDELQHGGHGWYILYEGNVSVAARGDFTHGSASHITYFRDNYYMRSYCGPQVHDAYAYTGSTNFPGCWVTNFGGFYGFDFEEYNHSNSVVGCVVSPSMLLAATPGLPAIFTNTASTQLFNDNPMVMRLGFLEPGGLGKQSDPSIAPATYYHGNWDPVNSTVMWDPSVSVTNRVIPNSLYLSNAPAWWPTNTTPWPAIGPDLSPMVGTVPAVPRLAQLLHQLTQPIVTPPGFHRIN